MSKSLVDEWINDSLRDCIIFMSVILVCMLGFMAVLSTPLFDKSKAIYTTHWYGRITDISNCQIGKYSYTCKVRVDNGNIYYLDMSDFPSESFQVGDRIGYQHE